MSETAKKDFQAPWNCRWSRLGHRFIGIPEQSQPEGLWLCVRPPSARRSVTEEECARCEFWELADEPEPES